MALCIGDVLLATAAAVTAGSLLPGAQNIPLWRQHFRHRRAWLAPRNEAYPVFPKRGGIERAPSDHREAARIFGEWTLWPGPSDDYAGRRPDAR